MKKTILIMLGTTLLLSPMAIASGSSGSSGGFSGGSSVDPYNVTAMMKCVITEITPGGTILVRDTKSNETHRLALNSETKLSAQDKRAFDGRKRLDREDLRVGQEIKIVSRQANGEVLKVKVLKRS